MTINKFMESRAYLKNTIRDYSNIIKCLDVSPDRRVKLSFDSAKDIAICLHWLEVIFDSLAESEISELKLDNKMFEYRYEY